MGNAGVVWGWMADMRAQCTDARSQAASAGAAAGAAGCALQPAPLLVPWLVITRSGLQADRHLDGMGIRLTLTGPGMNTFQ